MKSKTFEYAKLVLISATLLLVVVLGVIGLIGIGNDSSYSAVAGWYVAGAIGFWLSVASISIRVMALNGTRENESNANIGALRLSDWLVIFFSAVVAGLTIFFDWFVLSWIVNGIHPNLVRQTVASVALVSTASSAALCVYFRLPWAKYIFLALATLLLLRSELWLQFPGFSQSVLAGSFMVGYKSFPTLLALASFGYLHRRFGELSKNH